MIRFKLTGKMASILLAAAAASLLLTAPFAYRSFDQELLDFRRDHLRVVSADLHGGIGNLMAIGLPLGALRRAQDMIERTRSRNADIGAILIYDSTGLVLYSTDQGEIGSHVPADWPREGDDRDWSWAEDDALVVGAPLINDFGNVAGHVAIRADTARLARQREEAWLLLGSIAVGGFALAGVLAVAGSRLALRRLRDGLMAMAGAAEAFAAGRPASGEEGGLFGAFLSKARAIEEEIAALDREVSRLDEQV